MAAEEINPPVEKIGDRWEATDSATGYRRNEDHVNLMNDRRQQEWEQMQSYIETDECLMVKMRRLLDDSTLKGDDQRCGKCGVCCNEHPKLTSYFSERLAEAVVVHVKRSKKTFVCKQEPPTKFAFSGSMLPGRVGFRAEEGRVLSYWTDVGWGSLVQKGKASAKFSDELVYAMADMINQWRPWTWKKNWGWVTCVPSNSESHKKLVPDFAYRLANRLRLPFRKVVVKVGENEPQKERKNNYHRCQNLDGVFKVKEQEKLFRGPVLLLDDIVRSTWTITVIAALLKQAGSGPVFPVSLALIGTED